MPHKLPAAEKRLGDTSNETQAGGSECIVVGIVCSQDRRAGPLGADCRHVSPHSTCSAFTFVCSGPLLAEVVSSGAWATWFWLQLTCW